VIRPLTVIRAGGPQVPMSLRPSPLVMESGPMKVQVPEVAFSAGIAFIAASARVRANVGTPRFAPRQTESNNSRAALCMF
jgi:hypothetical protein